MKKYTLKSIGKNTDYMTILREMEDGFVVQIVRDMDGYEDIKTDYTPGMRSTAIATLSPP